MSTKGEDAVVEPEVLSAPLVLEYPFRRTVGRVQSAFLTGLRERVVLGVRGSDGRVLCPPCEYDPLTSEELHELVELGTEGTVTTWSWEPEGRPNQPLPGPFAWALVRLDGADTGLLHALDAPSPEAMATGMRARIRWAEERRGDITDIACFEPAGDTGQTGNDGPAGNIRPAGNGGRAGDTEQPAEPSAGGTGTSGAGEGA